MILKTDETSFLEFWSYGSGKSTILDGMILALYGMKAMSRGTNEFVNKNCKSALVSYEFQITGGAQVKRYRVEREFKAGEKGQIRKMQTFGCDRWRLY